MPGTSVESCYTKLNIFSRMAKISNAIIRGARGKLGQFVLVKKRIGQFIRAARGTIKPAVLNEKMEESSKRMAIANVPAKAIFDAVRKEHKDGLLWNKLTAVFRRQLKAGIPFHIHDLKDMECHEECTLDRLMVCSSYHVEVNEQKDAIFIELFMTAHPDWSHLEWRHEFQYRLSVIAVFPDLVTGHFSKETVHGPVTDFALPVAPVSFEVRTPVPGGDYLLFLLADAYYDEEVSGLEHAKGMRIVGLGQMKKSVL
jgi:hypothetical protein